MHNAEPKMMTSRFGLLLLTVAVIAAACGRESPSAFPTATDTARRSWNAFEDPPPPDQEQPMPDVPPDAPPDAPPAVPPTVISIVGSAGTGAFVPNPLMAATGGMLVWTNVDSVPHHIVLSDGTDLGIIAPGEASTPTAMTASSVGYYCTFHPSMTGIISEPSAMEPVPPPVYEPPSDYGYEPPSDYGYGRDDYY